MGAINNAYSNTEQRMHHLIGQLEDEGHPLAGELRAAYTHLHGEKPTSGSSDHVTVLPAEDFDTLAADTEPDEPNQRVRDAAKRLKNEVVAR